MHIKNMILAGIGFIFLGLGAIGVFLPVLPTTPFVLVSAACFSSSPKLRAKVMQIKFFREHIENYENWTGLTKRTVVKSLSFLWGMLLISMAMVRTVWIVVLLTCIGTAVTLHILSMARPKVREGEEAE